MTAARVEMSSVAQTPEPSSGVLSEAKFHHWEGGSAAMFATRSFGSKDGPRDTRSALNGATKSGGDREEESELNTITAPTPAAKWNLAQESRLLFGIAIPTIAVQFSIFLIFPQTASSVGRTIGTEELAGFSLASLIGNMTCLSVIIGTLSAAETLQPRAFGAGDYAEVGLLAVRGVAACAFALVPPVVPLLVCTDRILVFLGQDSVASLFASTWVRVYLLGVPSVVLFRTTQRFLACQGIVWPMVYAGALGCFLIHPILLRLFVPTLGFAGSALAVVTTQLVQASSALLYLRFVKPHISATWPGLTRSFLWEAVRPGPMMKFLELSLGGVLSFAEWWFWETVCFLAGRFGVVPLCVHTIAYQLVPTLFMIPLGLSIGMSVRIGTVLARDVDVAKRIAKWTMGFTAVLATGIALLFVRFQRPIVLIFTTDEEVIEGCARIWSKVAVFLVVLFCFGINSGIMRALGLQWRMAGIITCFTWCSALPAMVVFAIRRNGGLETLWTILPVAYLFMNAALFLCYSSVDWHEISRNIQRKAQLSEREAPDEKMHLLAQERRQSLSGDLYI